MAGKPRGLIDTGAILAFLDATDHWHRRCLETMRTLSGPFDLIFIDADKANYLNYYRQALDLLSPNGVILIDNVLWSGEVLKQPPPDERTAAIQELNQAVAQDSRVNAVLVTLRDGVLVVKRKPGAA